MKRHGRLRARAARPRWPQRIPGCESVYYGHIGDGNLHLVAWVPGLAIEQQPKDAMDEVIYGLVREFGGTVSAEHGIGTVKKRWLGHARSPEEIALMQHAQGRARSRGPAQPGQGGVSMAAVFDRPRCSRASKRVLAALLLGMVLMVFGNVVLRYAFNSGIQVSEELSRFFFVWLTFIGAIVAMRDGTHLGMDALRHPPVAARQAGLPGGQRDADRCWSAASCCSGAPGASTRSTRPPWRRSPGISMIWVFGIGYLTSVAIGAHALHELWRIATGRMPTTN